MSACKVDTLVVELSSISDLEKLLESHALSPVETLNMLTSKRGRQLLAARRRLARIHARLVATRYAPFAVQRLCQLLMDDKPELRLKSALSVLTVAGLAKHRPKKENPENNQPHDQLPDMSDDEVREVLRVLSRKAGDGRP